MKRTLLFVAVALTLSVMVTQAIAAPAFLVRCELQTSAYTGMTVLVGTYAYQGDELQRVFPIGVGYCPQSIEVY